MTSLTPADRVAARMDEFLERLSERDRAAVEKHLATCDAEPDRTHGNLYRHLAGLLASLAPMVPRRRGIQAIQFFIADGPYRKQVFALEDRHNGVVILYLPDVLAKAIPLNLLARNPDNENFLIPGSPDQPISLTIIDSSQARGTPEHVEHMLGWNRKALRLVLGTGQSNPAELKLADALCRLAAEDWAKPAT